MIELSDYATQESGFPLLTSSRQGLFVQEDYFIDKQNYREGKLTPEEYLSGKDALAQKQAALKEQLETCETQLEVFHQQSLNAEEQHEAASRMTGLPDDKLREHLYDAVERVLVYDTETIEIVWKFNESKIDTDENIGVAN